MSQSKFGDFLNFKVMISPVVILVLFWLGLVAIVIAAIVLFEQGKILAGIGTVILGPFAWRITCEYAMLGFRMHACLEQIAERSGTAPITERSGTLKQQAKEFGISIDDITVGKNYETRDERHFKVVEFRSDGLKVEYSEGKGEILAPIDSEVPHGLWTFDIRRT
jgi:hypothetical protein